MVAAERPLAWVLNLDVEQELASPGPHTPTGAMITRIEALRPRLAELLGAHLVLWPGGPTLLPPGHAGRAWCPTRWALGRMRAVGAAPPQAPAQEVLRRVNHRRFSFSLGSALAGASWAEDPPALQRVLADGSGNELSARRLLRRPYGFAGRGRRVVEPGALSADDQRWIEASLRGGEGLLVEPWLARSQDYALHGYVRPDATWSLGQVTEQRVDPNGAWLESRLEQGALAGAHRALLTREAERAAEALGRAGYFGPFGVDAFTFRLPAGGTGFQPRSEINARYSMGWATGMGRFQAPAEWP